MNNFLNGIKNATNYTRTENGAVAHKTTKSDIVDLFAQIGALRPRTENDIINMFNHAFNEDQLVAVKMAFYARDIRGGLGERRTFRVILRHLAFRHPEIVFANLEHIAEFGRWDDLFVLIGTTLEPHMATLVKTQWLEDLTAEYPSLLAKWLPSENASSRETIRRARIMRNHLGLSSKQYRKLLSKLRARIGIVERLLSSKEFSAVDYSKLPSKAAMQYRQAFFRNDEVRYKEYLDALSKPEALANGVKVNADTLYPYDIVKKIIEEMPWPYRNYRYGSTNRDTYKDLYNAQWNALPDYIGENRENSIAVIDTSGSMTCDNMMPISSALGLGIYMAQKNTGYFHNHFITFASRPELVEIKDDNLWDIMRNVPSIIDNTNVEAVFDLILNTAVENKLAQEELPARVYIISDMEFDSASGIRGNKKQTLFATIREKFKRAGYTMPNLVFWNVHARNAQFPMTIDDAGIQMVSGHSPAIFEAVMKGEMLNPLDLVLSVINKERYDCITLG